MWRHIKLRCRLRLYSLITMLLRRATQRDLCVATNTSGRIRLDRRTANGQNARWFEPGAFHRLQVGGEWNNAYMRPKLYPYKSIVRVTKGYARKKPVVKLTVKSAGRQERGAPEFQPPPYPKRIVTMTIVYPHRRRFHRKVFVIRFRGFFVIYFDEDNRNRYLHLFRS